MIDADLPSLIRRCSGCREPKIGTEFYIRRSGKRAGDLLPYCKSCVTSRSRAWRRANPEQARRAYRRRHVAQYGITLERYEELEAEQGGVCAICERPPEKRSLDVDHCHATGAVRGLLCSRCNRVLGYAADDPDLLQRLIDYLLRIPVGA